MTASMFMAVSVRLVPALFEVWSSTWLTAAGVPFTNVYVVLPTVKVAPAHEVATVPETTRVPAAVVLPRLAVQVPVACVPPGWMVRREGLRSGVVAAGALSVQVGALV